MIKKFIVFFLIGLTSTAIAQTTITMKKQGGVYVVPCTVNGLKLSFIFDTGANDVSISLTEALFMLKNDYLTEDDLGGKEYYTIANGDIAEGTKVILREIEFGGLKLYDVEASIVHKLSAPLLLGQSAIRKLGKIQLDPENNTLTILKGTTNTNKEIDFSHDKVLSIKDINGNQYKTVAIGTQTWMAENLKVTKFNDGTPIGDAHYGELFESKKFAWEIKCNSMYYDHHKCGNVYNWVTVNSGKLCPVGWHVPSDQDWIILSSHLGGDTISGGKLKNGPDDWENSKLVSFKLSGFNALPCDYENIVYARDYTWELDEYGSCGYWWSSTGEMDDRVIIRKISSKSTNFYREVWEKRYHYLFSIRCLKD